MKKLAELITDPVTNTISHTKIWTNIAYLAATAAFVCQTIFSDNPFSWEMWLIYLGVVGGHNAFSKYVSMKYGASNDSAS